MVEFTNATEEGSREPESFCQKRHRIPNRLSRVERRYIKAIETRRDYLASSIVNDTKPRHYRRAELAALTWAIEKLTEGKITT